jgi:acetylglutamate kinase
MVKVGGALLEEAAGLARLAAAVVRALAAGHEVVLLHGGGNQMRSLQKRLSIPDTYHAGLRVTDAATAEVALMVLGGSVNRTVVAALGRAGLPAVGLTGADGRIFHARRKLVPGVELGYVGEAVHFVPTLIELLLGARFVPVVASVAPLHVAEDAPCDRFYNINADEAAGPMAAAFRCDAALFLTDVPGVLDADRRLLALITEADAARLARDGVIAGGMQPKVDAAVHAARAGCALVKILPGDGPDPILAGLLPGRGTEVRADA